MPYEQHVSQLRHRPSVVELMAMTPFFKRAVAFFGRKSVSDTLPSDISNDELVTAHEWLAYGGQCADVSKCGVCSDEVCFWCTPYSVKCTVRELQALQ